MAKSKKTEAFELADKGIVTVSDLLRQKRGINKVQHTTTDTEEMQVVIDEQKERIVALEKEIDQGETDSVKIVEQAEQIKTLEAKITEQKGVIADQLDLIDERDAIIAATDIEMKALRADKEGGD